MKKRGFTLIELLAVVVILVIIVLIATPIILNIVEKSRKESFRDSIYGILEITELDAMLNEANLPFSYVIEGNKTVPEVNFSGKLDAYGEIIVNEKGQTKVEVDNGKWCAKKEYNESKIVLSSSPCTDNPIIMGNLTVEPKWGDGLLVTSSATSKTSTITEYEFIVKKQNEIITSYTSELSEYLFPFEHFDNNEEYQFEVVVKDNQNHTNDTSVMYLLSYEPVITRYLVVEVFEHLNGNGAVINELEFLDNHNEKIDYTVGDVYDSTTKGLPFYWNSSSYWSQNNLNNGTYSYNSNPDGGQTSTLFIYNSNETNKYARFLIDFGEEKEIKTIKLWTGGSDRRQPRNIKIYRYSLELNSSFKKDYIETRDDTLPIIYDKTFTSIYETPTNNTNYFIYPEDTKEPIITEIKVANDFNILQVKVDVTDPYYSSGIKEYRYALVKDNGILSYDNIPWSESKKTNNIEYDLENLEEGTYYIYVEAIDNALHKTYKVSSPYEFSKRDINSRYIIMEIYDHFSSNGSVITELEIYNNSSQKIAYDIPKIYDKSTNGVPYYWTSTAWPKTRLYDGKTAYTSNSQGSTTSTIFNYSSAAGTGVWTRMIVDFSKAENIKNLKIWLGGPEGRLPKEVHFYVSENSDIDAIYNQNIKERDNTSLVEFTRFSFSENITTVTKFEKNNLVLYKFQKK